jgi:hypothetical protein
MSLIFNGWIKQKIIRMNLDRIMSGNKNHLWYKNTLLVAGICSILSVIFCGVALASHNWDAKAFIMMGERFKDLNHAGDLGYDGQFVYYIAADPLNAPVHIDHAAYRYQRILYPFLAWLLSFGGKQSLLPWVMLLINIVAITVTIGLTGEILAEKGVQAWHAIALLFSAGLLISLRADLNEPLAILWALVGMILAYQKKWLWAGFSFALGILAKEIAITFAFGAAIWLFFEWRFRDGMVVLVTSLLPAILWGIFLTAWLGQSPLTADQAAMETLPFYGLLFVGVSPAKAIILLWVAIPAILYGLVGTFDLLKGRTTMEVFMLMASVALVAFMPRLTWYNAAGALRAVVGLVVVSLVYTASRWPRLVPWIGAYWITSGLVMIPVLVLGPFVN